MRINKKMIKRYKEFEHFRFIYLLNIIEDNDIIITDDLEDVFKKVFHTDVKPIFVEKN